MAEIVNRLFREQVAIGFQNLSAQDIAILKHCIPQNQVLRHAHVGSTERFHVEEPAEICIIGPLGRHGFRIRCTTNMRMCDKEVSLQHGLDAFHRHRLSIRSGVIDSLPHSRIEWHPGISILRKAEARKLIKETIFLIQ